jgi:hypothetical protein
MQQTFCVVSRARARRTETETMADVSDYSEYDDSMMDDDDDGSDFYDSENPSPVMTKKKGGAAVRLSCVGSRSPLHATVRDCSTTVSFSDAFDDDDDDDKDEKQTFFT